MITGWSVLICIIAYAGVYHKTGGDKYSTFSIVIVSPNIFIYYLINNKFYENRDTLDYSNTYCTFSGRIIIIIRVSD